MLPISRRVDWMEYEHPDQVIVEVVLSLVQEKTIDLLITDYNHPGINGLELARIVKALAARFDVRIPILMITMRVEKSLVEEPQKPNPVIDKFFGKNVEGVEIMDYLKQTLAL